MAQERTMQKPLSVYRVYARTYDSFKSLQNVTLQNQDEIHVVLAFARDYGSRGNPTNGVFHPYFEITDVAPDDITKIKSANNRVKFFLSIGGRNPNFPFQQADPRGWVNNAIKSLGGILRQYHFDGIDVYYEHINNTTNDQNNFVPTMKDLIGGLAKDNIFPDGRLLLSSITVSAPLKDQFYQHLAQLSNYVVYQTHSDVNSIHTPEDLLQFINHITPPYPGQRLLAGHSFLEADWATVPPPVFFGAIPQILNKGLGISMIVDDDRDNI